MKTHEYLTPKKLMQNPIIEEIERYAIITEYFWTNAVARLRENKKNKQYLDNVVLRLKEMGLPTCSDLIKRVSKCHLPEYDSSTGTYK